MALVQCKNCQNVNRPKISLFSDKKSVDQRIFYTSETSFCGFGGSEIEKRSVGKLSITQYVYEHIFGQRTRENSPNKAQSIRRPQLAVLTDPFTALELQNPPLDVPELNIIPRSPDLEALKSRKGRSGAAQQYT